MSPEDTGQLVAAMKGKEKGKERKAALQVQAPAL